MSFIIDVSNGRIKRAMKALGIESDDLLVKDIESFGGRNTDDEIKELRHSFYNRKQQELIRQIKAHIREEIRWYHENKRIKVESESFEVQEGSGLDEDGFERVKDKHKRLVSKHLESVKGGLKEGKALQVKLKLGEKIRESAITSLSKQRVKMKELREKQRENIEKIAQKTMFLNSKFGRRELYAWTPVKNRKKVVSLSPNSAEVNPESEISEKIQRFEEKMLKSEELSQNFMRNKKENMAKLLHRSSKNNKIFQSDKDSEYAEKLAKIVEKTHRALERRSNILKTQTEKRMKKREYYDDRRIRTKSKLEERQRSLEKKFKDIEEKMIKSEYILGKKNEMWLKELEYRNELQRLKDEETLNNAERKKRISKNKRDIILEKQQEDHYRIQCLKDEREEDLRKKADLAIKTMIEKEKFYEAIVNINKSPESKLLKNHKTSDFKSLNDE